ncbi:hypothetical protein H9P43_007251 [Blastocladiella emersonii ATCC 22665]|nr:hypothetical protein H9P43_007251 [Blastocladiella emersonii ATCC 22665]
MEPDQPPTDPSLGLPPAEVARRAATFGPNSPPPLRPGKPLLRVLLSEAQEPMMLLLFAVAAGYLVLGELAEAVVVTLAVLAMVAIEMVTEHRAKVAVKNMSAPAASIVTVRRDGGRVEVVSSVELVPGDIVLLDRGQAAPADLRVVADEGALLVNEATYSGENEPVQKTSAAALAGTTEGDIPRNVVLTGSVVVAGRGTFIVTATGPATRLAQLGGLKPPKQPKTHLAKLMKRLAYFTTLLAAAVVASIVAYGTLALHLPWRETLLLGLTLAFATIPEELPLMVKVVLAAAAHDLTDSNVVVRRLRALEQLAGVTALVTDKTGTLTENKMALAARLVPGAADGAEPTDDLLAAWAASAVAWTDPHDAAVKARWGDAADQVLAAAAAAGPVIEQSVDPDTMLRRVVRASGTVLRGAPETLLALASRTTAAGPLSATLKSAESARFAHWAAQGYRLIGIATQSSESGLTYLGALAFTDPVRLHAPEWLAACRAAGTWIVLATGDHPGTAHAVARAVGGVDEVHARCSPEAKVQLVRQLADAGHRVLFVGDGANDSAAMRAAAVAAVVAASPGRADAALDAADVVLLGRGLDGIAEAVRVAHWATVRVRQAVAFYLACKLALVALTVVCVAVFGAFPFSAVQLLVLEMSMDLGATTLFAREPMPLCSVDRTAAGSPDTMFGASLARWIAGAATPLLAAVLAAFALGRAFVVGASLDQARSMAFVTWMLAHIVLAYAMRSPAAPLRAHGFTSRVAGIWLAVAVVVVAGMFALVAGPAGLVPIAREGWIVCLAASLVPLGVDVVREVQWSVAQRGEGEGVGETSPLLHHV